MRPRGWLSRRAAGAPIDRAVGAFEQALASGRTTLERFWEAQGAARSPTLLAALIKVDLWRQFEAGRRPRVLDYLARFPALAGDSERVVSLVYEEFCLLQEVGANPDSTDFCRDYGPWRDSLASQLAYHRELSRAVGPEATQVDYPKPGELFDRYRLRSLLGEGGVARVYLATEEGLGERQVVIKISASFGQEPSILARLDHRNIVPILTVAESPGGLRGICMPYRPGRTLEDLIVRIGRGKPPRTAREVFEALRVLGRPDELPSGEPDSGWAGFPVDKTFPEAVAWIGHRLARALAYLHKRGFYHRDIKPANILLAYTEGPQLLDFNLAKEPNNPEGASVAQRGGTLPYMAPEQLVAFLDPSAWSSVGEAADLYSLGLVLREMLTGRGPDLPTSRGSLPREIRSVLDRRLVPFEPIREINPAVPPALESILSRCLALRAEDRYGSAGELEADLRRFLERRPLLVAPNPSRFERGFNCCYRNRKAVLAAVLGVASFVTLLNLVRGDESGLAAFNRANAYLESGEEGDLERAKEAFEALHRDRPETARSSLGLALTLLKLDAQDTAPINELLKEAAGKPDAEAVLEGRLAGDPGSGTLLRTLGHVLTQKGALDRGRVALERSLRAEPEAIPSMILLGNLEQKAGRDEAAWRHYERAIGLALRNGAGPDLVHKLRNSWLMTLVRVIDRALVPGGPGEDRSAAARLLVQFKAGLASFEGDFRAADKVSPDEHEFARDYLLGCSASIEAALTAEADVQGRSSSLFRQAEERFEAARASLSRIRDIREQLAMLAIQGKALEERRSASGVDR